MTQPQIETPTVDVHVHGGGPMCTVYSFELMTDAARQWVDENVQAEAWQWLGHSLAVEHGYTRELAQGMLDAGLNVV